MRQRPMQTGDFEYESLRLLERRGHRIERVNSDYLRRHFPAWNADRYPDGFLDFESGYAESGRAVAALIEGARSIGVELREHAKFCALDETSDRVKGIVFESGEKLPADAVVMAVGAWTPYVLPFTHDFSGPADNRCFTSNPLSRSFSQRNVFPSLVRIFQRRGFTVSRSIARAW
jgi:Glycine/D-amino acid oxidases (deaminating)